MVREREVALKRFVNFVERLRPHIARKSAVTLGRVWRGHVGRRAHRDARREHLYRQMKARELEEVAEMKRRERGRLEPPSRGGGAGAGGEGC